MWRMSQVRAVCPGEPTGGCRWWRRAGAGQPGGNREQGALRRPGSTSPAPTGSSGSPVTPAGWTATRTQRDRARHHQPHPSLHGATVGRARVHHHDLDAVPPVLGQLLQPGHGTLLRPSGGLTEQPLTARAPVGPAGEVHEVGLATAQTCSTAVSPGPATRSASHGGSHRSRAPRPVPEHRPAGRRRGRRTRRAPSASPVRTAPPRC